MWDNYFKDDPFALKLKRERMKPWTGGLVIQENFIYDSLPVQTMSALGGSTYRPGIATLSTNINQIGGADAFSWVYDAATGNKVNNGSSTAYGSGYGNAAKIGVALDMGSGKVWFALNGTWQNSGDPAAGTNAAFSGLSGTLYALASQNDNGFNITANFSGVGMTIAIPSGFTGGL